MSIWGVIVRVVNRTGGEAEVGMYYCSPMGHRANTLGTGYILYPCSTMVQSVNLIVCPCDGSMLVSNKYVSLKMYPLERV